MRHYLLILTILVFLGCKQRAKVRYQPREVTVLDTCKSLPCLDSILKKEPGNLTALFRYGQLLQSQRKYLDAIAVLTTLINIDSTYSTGFVFRDRANCKNNLHNDTGAVNDMNEAIKLNPGERYFYVDRGDYLCNLEKNESALKDYDKALQIWDQHIPARVGRAKVLVRLKQYGAAKAEYDILTNTSEFSVNDFYYRGIARFHSNDKNGACEDWKSVYNYCPETKDSVAKHCR